MTLSEINELDEIEEQNKYECVDCMHFGMVDPKGYYGICYLFCRYVSGYHKMCNAIKLE